MSDFHFNWYKKAGEAFLYALPFAIVVFILEPESTAWWQVVLGVVVLALLIFLTRHGRQLLERYRIEAEGLSVRRFLLADQFYPFRQTRRVVIRKEKNALSADRVSLTLFLESGEKKKITVSDLHQSVLFLQQLEERAQQFKVIHQNERGEVFRTV